MSLKFFFNRKGNVVLGMTLLGWSLTLRNLFHLKNNWETRGYFTNYFFLFTVFLAFLITVIRFFPWYAKEDRGAGIEDHFEKTFVPVVYLLVIIELIFNLWMNCWPLLLFAAVFFTLILYVNAILITFYFKDTDPIRTSFFARNLYLK